MLVTRQTVADQLASYLHHATPLEALVDWAEGVMQEGDIDKVDGETIPDIIGRLGVAEVKTFGLTWEDCERFLQRLGYDVRVEVVAQG